MKRQSQRPPCPVWTCDFAKEKARSDFGIEFLVEQRALCTVLARWVGALAMRRFGICVKGLGSDGGGMVKNER
jgi:hypothetical protein